MTPNFSASGKSEGVAVKLKNKTSAGTLKQIR